MAHKSASFICAVPWKSDLWNSTWHLTDLIEVEGVECQQVDLNTFTDSPGKYECSLCLIHNLGKGRLAPLQQGSFSVSKKLAKTKDSCMVANTAKDIYSDDYPISFIQNAFTFIADAQGAKKGKNLEWPMQNPIQFSFMMDLLEELDVDELKAMLDEESPAPIHCLLYTSDAADE